MKKFWMQLLLMPLFPLFGLAVSGGKDDSEEEDPNDEEEEETEEEEESDEPEDKSKKGKDDNKSGKGGQKGRVFTQQQVTAMMTEEKKQGRRSVLKALGFKSLEEAKRVLAAEKKKNAIEDDEEDEEEEEERKPNRKTTSTKKSTKPKQTSEDVANRYSYLVACIKAGVDPDDADDVVDLVLKRKDEDDDFEDALKEFKKAKPAFFGKGNGTGNSPRGKKGGSREPDSLGARLGKQVPKSGKNPYFID